MVGSTGPELFAIAGKSVYYHMSPACAKRYEGLCRQEDERRALDMWYPYKTFLLADLDMPTMPTPSLLEAEGIVHKYRQMMSQDLAVEATWPKIHELKRLGDQFLEERGQIDKCEMPPDHSRFPMTEAALLQLVTELQQQLVLAKTAFDAKQRILQLRSICGLLIQYKTQIGGLCLTSLAV